MIRRNHTGHRVGESHQKAKQPDAVVRKARQLRKDGHPIESIAVKIGVPYWTVVDWMQYKTRRSA